MPEYGFIGKTSLSSMCGSFKSIGFWSLKLYSPAVVFFGGYYLWSTILAEGCWSTLFLTGGGCEISFGFSSFTFFRGSDLRAISTSGTFFSTLLLVRLRYRQPIINGVLLRLSCSTNLMKSFAV
jgi:hypothetical protein